MIFTKEQHAFLREYIPGHHHKEIVKAFNERFGTEITEAQTMAYCKNHKIHTGFTGKFYKGQPSLTKGISFPTTGRMGETQFKKGNRPHNALPVGSEAVRDDGYIQVKVAEPNVWRFKHRIVWEAANGPVPEGGLVIFADGNRLNCELDNLRLIDKATNAVMNSKRLRVNSLELIDTCILTTELFQKTMKAKSRRK